MAVNETTNRIYVANYNSDSVSVIDGATGNVIGSPIAVGDSPYGVAVNEATNRIYVANYDSDSVSVIDGATGNLVGSPIAVGAYPYDVAVNEATNRIYVANSDSDSVSVIDGATGDLIGSPIAVGDYPSAWRSTRPRTASTSPTTTSDTVSVIQDAALIEGFTPASGPVGTTVTITGRGLLGASAVAFGGVPRCLVHGGLGDQDHRDGICWCDLWCHRRHYACRHLDECGQLHSAAHASAQSPEPTARSRLREPRP